MDHITPKQNKFRTHRKCAIIKVHVKIWGKTYKKIKKKKMRGWPVATTLAGIVLLSRPKEQGFS
jgi:glutamine amidotransferase PdxT